MMLNLTIFGAAAIAAVAAVARDVPDMFTAALMLITMFWTVVRIAREAMDPWHHDQRFDCYFCEKED